MGTAAIGGHLSTTCIIRDRLAESRVRRPPPIAPPSFSALPPPPPPTAAATQRLSSNSDPRTYLGEDVRERAQEREHLVLGHAEDAGEVPGRWATGLGSGSSGCRCCGALLGPRLVREGGVVVGLCGGHRACVRRRYQLVIRSGCSGALGRCGVYDFEASRCALRRGVFACVFCVYLGGGCGGRGGGGGLLITGKSRGHAAHGAPSLFFYSPTCKSGANPAKLDQISASRRPLLWAPEH